MTDFVAFVPMRHESERVPHKNYRLLNGVPLYHYVIRTLMECPEIKKIVIDTDSPNILEDAREVFPEVALVERPHHLRDGGIPINEILCHDASLFESDFYLQTHCTNPLLQSDTIRAAMRMFCESYPRNDSLFGVARVQKFLWDAVARPINHNPDMLARTQDLPAVYEENSNLYLFSAEVLATQRRRLGARPILFEMDRGESWDIDDELDFQVAEFLIRKQEAGE